MSVSTTTNYQKFTFFYLSVVVKSIRISIFSYIFKIYYAYINNVLSEPLFTCLAKLLPVVKERISPLPKIWISIIWYFKLSLKPAACICIGITPFSANAIDWERSIVISILYLQQLYDHVFSITNIIKLCT
jgi:hypothetical protein